MKPEVSETRRLGPAWPAAARNPPSRGRGAGRGIVEAFTLLEVMIAMAIFFMAIFAILSLVSTNLRNARLLQEQPVDASALIAELSLTNKLTEGSDQGDFGDLHPGYVWKSDTTEVMTNGMFEVDYTVTGPRGRGRDHVETHMSVLLWRPLSTASAAPGAPRRSTP